MYVSLRSAPGVAAPAVGARWRSVGRNVVLLGLVSLITDVSSEMVVAILPLYFTYQLRLSPFVFGLMDGVYQGGSALVRIMGGLVADRRGRHKEVAAAGYGLSAVCKLGLLFAGGSWGATGGVLLADRLGKGIRTPPRDALISLSADRNVLGRAFGLHRAMDTTGALLGPLLAFSMLAAAPKGYDSIFVASFCIGLVGLGILILFVEGRGGRSAAAPAPAADPSVSLRAALGLLRVRSFRAVVLAGGQLGLFTISDAFVYLLIQRQTDMSVKWFPLLYLGTALAYLALAVPVGLLADRVGRSRVFLCGYLPLAAVYCLLLVTDLSTAVVLCCLALLGTYYAATDGVLMAAASTSIPERIRTSGLAIVTTVTAGTRFAASIVFGGLWVLWGPHASVVFFLAGLGVALVSSSVGLRRA